MKKIVDRDVIRCKLSLRNPFEVETLPLLAQVFKIGFQPRRRVSKRFVGKPAKLLFRFLMALGVEGRGRVRVETPSGLRTITFRARNTMFGALYQSQYKFHFEPETSGLLDRLVGDRDVFFDVGANWGWYSVLIATRPRFQGTIHAFEPFPSTFDDLISVVRQADLYERVICHEVALSNREGEGEMAIPGGVHSGLARLGDEGGILVKLAKLDRLSLPAPLAIKIDAENHELGVLEGAIEIIDDTRPFIIFENWLHRDKPWLTLGPLALLSSRRYCFYSPGWVHGEPDCILNDLGTSSELALVPFVPELRFQLSDQINIFAVPVERKDEFCERLA